MDDWPLHGVKGVNTTLVVGGCWQGRSNAINFHFRGFLAGLSILRGATESGDVLQCLHRCKEGLVLPPADSTDPGTELTANPDSTEVIINGRDPIDVEDMLSQISYSNSREFPTPGRRSLRISTSIQYVSIVNTIQTLLHIFETLFISLFVCVVNFSHNNTQVYRWQINAHPIH